ncbi:MAG TPA: helix-turn-helix domain-containing protein [Burkholderia sp.]|nr:helix-turn-helix domain-containing protein [Burkholderia sp.]
MQLHEIGRIVAKRRTELDLTQHQLAKLAGVSILTVNQLEIGATNDIGISKLIGLLGVLGIEITAHPRKDHNGLYKAVVSANVSYKGELTERLWPTR